MKSFLKNNIVFLMYFLFSIILEISGLFVINGNVFITSPWLALSIVGIIFASCNFCMKRKTKNIIISIVFVLQCILNLFCVILYENTGTLFDFNMFQVAGEGTTFLNAININYLYICFVLSLLVLFFVSKHILNKYEDEYYRVKLSVTISSICLAISLISHVGVVVITNTISEENFINSLYEKSSDKYTSLGGSSNFINEIYKMLFFNNYNDLSNEEIKNYIYDEVSTPTSKFGVSSDNNLVTILAESFEWFAFISNPSVYPNGANLSEEILDELYPNLRKFYNMSVVMSNHHSQNKTDISEDEALLGSYTSNNYINYIFPNNTYPTSIANTLKSSDSSISNNFFHNNVGSYYNRNKMAVSLGYDNLYFMEEMIEEGVTDYMSQAGFGKINMNLDSEMVKEMKDYMFPANKRFNTHITTMSMHGNYEYRENMQKWLDKISNLGVIIENESVKSYMAAVMDFDCALGIMLDDLESKNLLENTTIVIFADHNAYLSDLTYYVKDVTLEEYSSNNFTKIFNVPLMIYDPNISHQIVSKFTTTYDIVPTILDMFGIKYYSNLYFGNSIFSNEESVLYSKAFDVFITDKLYFRSLNNILFKRDDVSKEYIAITEEKCLSLLKKIYYTNHIFEYDYFKSNDNYINKMKEINPQ